MMHTRTEEHSGITCPPADKAVPRTVAEKADWLQRHEAIVARARRGDIDLCFLGDSITEWWEGPRASKIWNDNFLGWKSVNFGIGGDCTQNVLWRLQNGALDGACPRVVVLQIGTNNADVDSPAKYTANDVATGVTAIVWEIRKRSSGTKILLNGILPRTKVADAPIRKKIREVNAIVANLDNGTTVKYMDIGDRYLHSDGTLNQNLFWDEVHISDHGYRVWAEAIRPTLINWLGEPLVAPLRQYTPVTGVDQETGVK